MLGAGCTAMWGEFNQAFHQIGNPPQGYLTFGLPDPAVGEFRWCRTATKGGEILNFNQESGFEGTSPKGFSGVTLSFRRETLEELAEILDLPLNLETLTKRISTIPTSTQETATLRMRMAAVIASRAEARQDSINNSDALFRDQAAIGILRLLSRSNPGKCRSQMPARKYALNRAVEILESHNNHPISVSTLCKLVGVSAPSLYRAFKEEFGVGTKQYIQSRLLAGVREQLISANPGAQVNDIANTWGFWHMGQFAALYRNHFGELPSETLRFRGS